VLAARRVHRIFRVGGRETLALQDVSVEVDRGELVALVGPSGSGKSTLIACLAGLDRPDGGTVHLDGQSLTAASEPERARLRARHLGILQQADNLLEHLTVLGNIVLVQRLAGAAVRPDPADLLADVGLEGRGTAYPSRLSGGETARAALAVALANDPPVLLADEPTGELDTAAEGHVLTLLRGCAARGTAVLIASHSPAIAAAADRRIGLIDGRVAP
jgi:putative ABC transport system ATP-binding protein